MISSSSSLQVNRKKYHFNLYVVNVNIVIILIIFKLEKFLQSSRSKPLHQTKNSVHFKFRPQKISAKRLIKLFCLNKLLQRNPKKGHLTKTKSKLDAYHVLLIICKTYILSVIAVLSISLAPFLLLHVHCCTNFFLQRNKENLLVIGIFHQTSNK